MMSLSQFIEQTADIACEADLFAALVAFCADRKIDLVSYHVTVASLRSINFDDGFFFNTFPSEWVSRYREKEYFKIDPIISFGKKAKEPYRWYMLEQQKDLTSEELLYLADLRRAGMVDGYGVPIQDREGTVAYFGCGSSTDLLELDHVGLLILQYACNQVHNRFVYIKGGIFEKPVALTKRETEVLQWIAGGKSKSVISQIMEISPHTVDTLTRRCFQKLDANDKVNAVLRAIGLGLITI